MSAVGTIALPPDAAGTVKAFSRIGYKLEEALADVVDNAVDAGAGRVEITLHRDDVEVTSVSIADNGCGMTPTELRAAMRFSSPQERRDGSLGVFGLGMKSASFSQCRSVTVIAKRGRKIAGCRWTDESILAGWRCELLNAREAEDRFGAAYAKPDDVENGVVVLWEQLDRLAITGGEEGLDAFLPQLLARLDLKLGMVFHRFIGSKFGIVLRARHRHRPSLPRRVRAYDPFAHGAAGRDDYPKTFLARLPAGASLRLEAHVWPYGSTDPEYLLGRRRGTSHQGFYFYRNGRLIEGGGWHGVLKDVTDPELSLARVAVDLPVGAIETNVQKSAIHATVAFSNALSCATAGQLKFQDYLNDARSAFRQGRRKPRTNAPAPLVLGRGVPVSLQRAVQRHFAKRGPARRIDFEWVALPADRIFEADPIGDRILLNKLHRSRLLAGTSASGTDGPLLKTLLFLLLEDELDRSRSSAQHEAWLARCNAVLLHVVRSL